MKGKPMTRLPLALYVAAVVCFAIALLSYLSDDFEASNLGAWLVAGLLADACAHVAERWPK